MAIYHLKRCVELLHRTLESFERTVLIILHKLLATVADSFDAFGDSGVSRVGTLTYYLEDESKDLHEAQISDVDDEFHGETLPVNSSFTCIFVIDDLIRRFLTNEVLQEAHDSVSRAV